MKKFLFLSLFCACFVAANAQLPDGSIAPNFTVYEIDKTNGSVISTNPYTLYEYTDAGKVVYLDFFGTWCGPCWNYHNTGAFESLYNQYGPEGTNEVMAFGLETGSGSAADLQGTGSNTYGNWLNGVLYPVIPLGLSPNPSSLAGNTYNVNSVPTIYMVCPCRLIFEVGQQTAADLYAAKSELCPQYDETLSNNGIVLELLNISNIYYCGMTATPKVKIENVGTAALTSAELRITLDGQTTTFPWTGNLSRYGTTDVTLPQISVNNEGVHTYSVELVSVNGVDDDDESWNVKEKTFYVSSEAVTEDVEQDFSNFTYPWVVDDDTYVGIHANNAMYFNAYYAPSGTTASLYSPLMDISRFQKPTLKFDVAHKRYSSNTERLQVQATSNCGSNWSTIYNKAGANLATVSGSASSAFVPTDSQWRTETVDLSNVSDKTKVGLKFKFTSGYGNMVWIDNIRIYEGLGLEDNESEELSIYPNPTTGMLYVSASEPVREVQVFNMQGQLVRSHSGDVHEISLFDLADGIYMVKVFAETGAMTTQKIVKQ